MKHRGIDPAEEERLEFWIEGAGGGKVELHTGFLELTHCNNRPLVPDAAEEGMMMLLEEVLAIMFLREEAGGFPRETSESWNAESEEGKRKRPDSGKPEAGSSFPGLTPAMERMPASILESKSRKAGRLAASSETRTR